jgi:hypothetical protein
MSKPEAVRNGEDFIENQGTEWTIALEKVMRRRIENVGGVGGGAE